MSLTGHVLGPRRGRLPYLGHGVPSMSLAGHVPGPRRGRLPYLGHGVPSMSLAGHVPGRRYPRPAGLCPECPCPASPAPADYPGCASVPPAPYTTRSIYHMLCRTIPMRFPCGRDARILEGTLRRTTALVPRPRRLQLRPAAVRSAFSWERGPLARNGPKARGCPCLFPAKAQKPAVAHAGKMPALPGQSAPAQNWRTKRTSPRRRS